MKIVHVVSSLQVGGMEQFVVRIAGAQRQAGHQASVLALQSGPLMETACQQGIPVSTLQGLPKPLRVAAAAKLFLMQRPDIIHGHNQTSLHYSVLGKRFCGAPVVMTNHGQGQGSARTPSADEWAQTDSIVTVSDAVADRMDRAQLGSKICTIYNGVQFAKPQRTRGQVRQELGIPEDRVVGVMVARVDHLKGHENLVNALGSLRHKDLLLTVLIVGDGARRSEREQQATSLGLGPEQIRFLGFRSDIPDLLGASDFFLLPSLTEGLPLSVLEAMSQGRPVIATRVGGIPELVTHDQHGLLIESQDEPALAAAIESLVAQPEKRVALGTAGRQRTEASFTFEKMLAEYDDLYRSLKTV